MNGENSKSSSAGGGASREVFTPTRIVERIRGSRQLVLFVVFFALLLDEMLMSVIVPIIPDFIFGRDHPDLYKEQRSEMNQLQDMLPTVIPTSLPVAMTAASAPPVSGSTPRPDWMTPSGANQTNEYSNKTIPLYHWISTTETPSVAGEERTEDSTLKLEVPQDPRLQQLDHVTRQENVKVGVLFGSKAFVQLLANPFVGTLTNRLGYSIPMFTGFVIIFVTTLVFAIGESYPVLMIARMLQGVGSSFSSVASLGMLASRYQEDNERGAAVGFATSGLAFGMLIGPLFGGVMYEVFGKSAPFYVLSVFTFCEGLLQLLILNPSVHSPDVAGASIVELLKDPYVLIAAGTLTFGNIGIAMLEPSLPLWMISKMSASKWQLGVVFLPSSVSYMISSNVFGALGKRIGRWLCCMVGLIVISVGLLVIPFCTAFPHLLIPSTVIGFGIGMVVGTIITTMAYLVDIRHSCAYGGVYAIGDIAICIGLAIGPSMSGAIAQAVGFSWMIRLAALAGFFYAPLCIFLRNPPAKEGKQVPGARASIIPGVSMVSDVSIILGFIGGQGIPVAEEEAISHTAEKLLDYQTMEHDNPSDDPD